MRQTGGGTETCEQKAEAEIQTAYENSHAQTAKDRDCASRFGALKYGYIDGGPKQKLLSKIISNRLCFSWFCFLEK